MKLRLKYIIMVLLFCISLLGCTQADKINEKQIGKQLENVLGTPDKIIIYSNGGSKELDKNSTGYKKVLELTAKRFHDKLSTALDIINDSAMEDIRKDGLGMEFVYTDEHELSVKGDKFQSFKYHKLYFQLTSHKSGNSQESMIHTLQYGDKDHYKDHSLASLKYSEELVKLVEEL